MALRSESHEKTQRYMCYIRFWTLQHYFDGMQSKIPADKRLIVCGRSSHDLRMAFFSAAPIRMYSAKDTAFDLICVLTQLNTLLESLQAQTQVKTVVSISFPDLFKYTLNTLDSSLVLHFREGWQFWNLVIYIVQDLRINYEKRMKYSILAMQSSDSVLFCQRW